MLSVLTRASRPRVADPSVSKLGDDSRQALDCMKSDLVSKGTSYYPMPRRAISASIQQGRSNVAIAVKKRSTILCSKLRAR
jgi:hypothetical protein